MGRLHYMDLKPNASPSQNRAIESTAEWWGTFLSIPLVQWNYSSWGLPTGFWPWEQFCSLMDTAQIPDYYLTESQDARMNEQVGHQGKGEQQRRQSKGTKLRCTRVTIEQLNGSSTICSCFLDPTQVNISHFLGNPCFHLLAAISIICLKFISEHSAYI